jgi:hypothetical protein
MAAFQVIMNGRFWVITEARVDRRRLDAGLAQPLQRSSRYELGTVF